MIVRNFHADVVLYAWDRLEIVQCDEDDSRFDSIDHLARDVKLHGDYGGIRLVKATIKKFVEYGHRQGVSLPARNFSIRYASSVPRQVGLAGGFLGVAPRAAGFPPASRPGRNVRQRPPGLLALCPAPRVPARPPFPLFACHPLPRLPYYVPVSLSRGRTGAFAVPDRPGSVHPARCPDLETRP